MPRGEQFARYYPGLVPAEAALWRRWLKDHETEFDRFEYNVRMGPGVDIKPQSVPPDSDLAAALSRMWRMLTQFKADVVAYNGPEVWIFEVKEQPNHGALGQLTTYAVQLARQAGMTTAPQLAVVCSRLPPNMLDVFLDSGITVYQLDVPPPTNLE